MPRRNRAPSLHSGGFTLVELLLAVALLALLLAAVAFNFSSLQRGQSLDQGASQFESLLRLARAHAALSGHNVLVALVPSSDPNAPPNLSSSSSSPNPLALAVLAQPDPLRNPSLLVPIPGAASLLPSLADLIQIEVPLPQGSPFDEASGPALANASTNTMANVPNPSDPSLAATPQSPSLPSVQALLTFRPDGSANAASFTLLSTDPEDPRRLQLSFDPISVSFQRRFFSNSGSTNDPVLATDAADDAQDQGPDAMNP